MPTDDAAAAASPTAQSDSGALRRIGPFEVSRNPDLLTLRFANRGELSFQGCLLFACLTLFVFGVGALALMQFATAPQPVTLREWNSPTRVLAPSNHFGLIWALSAIGTAIGIPIYVQKTYRGPLVFSFSRADGSFRRGRYRITSLRKIEYLTLRETLDPDDRYLYALELYYGDGRVTDIHYGYNERELMNLANEISNFVGVEVRWKA